MSKYTTGELAGLCGVTVRTVQYYDKRGILIPSELTEGGRRLYTDEDLNKLKIICFLRDAGLSINSIDELLSEDKPEKVISLIIEQKIKALEEDKLECEKKLKLLGSLKSSLRSADNFSVESIGDIVHVMKNKEKLKKVRAVVLLTAAPIGILEWSAILLWIFKGIWWMFAVYTLLAIPYIIWLFNYYRKNISYICPQCHEVFKPDKKEFFFARHTMTTRKLTCTCCGHKGFCVETAEESTGDEKIK